MATSPSRYQPISCAFHDVLEARATERRPVQIRFRDASGGVRTQLVVITDVFARDGAEYISIGAGETLRLDQLVQVGDAKPADY